jgi:hypothetical protein
MTNTSLYDIINILPVLCFSDLVKITDNCYVAVGYILGKNYCSKT